MEIITLGDDYVLTSNCYIILSGEIFSVVDPSVSYEKAKSAIPYLDTYKPGYVLLTHGHADHLWEIYSYVDVGCEVLATEHDASVAADSSLNCSALFDMDTTYNGKYRKINEGEIISVGDTSFTVLETPGHTAGSVCYLTEGLAFTGDTLFASGGYGRFDLPTGNLVQLRESLRRLFTLDENLKVYSGHGPVTTLGETKSFFG